MVPVGKLLAAAGRDVRGVLDVGAFTGQHSTTAAADHSDLVFVAVEPHPAFAQALRERTGDLSNYHVVEAAISTVNGVADLNVPTAMENFGSLLPISSNQDWDLVKLDPPVRVGTRTLADVLGEFISSGDIVAKIDTQGYDLQVIESLGPELPRLRAGVLETFVRGRHSPYLGAPSRADTVRFLRRCGFEIVAVESEHPNNHDQNLLFVRRDLLRRPRLWRAAYPLLLAAAWGRYLPTRLRVRAALKTRLRRLHRPS